MNDLIKINREDNGDATVSGRELWEALEVGSNYTTWFNRMCEYGFKENEDFKTCFPKLESETHGGQNKTDHLLTLDMAKEICMIQRTPQGRKFRKYFIEVEKEYRNNCFNYQQLTDRVERLEKLLTQQAQPVQPTKLVTMSKAQQIIANSDLISSEKIIYSIIAYNCNSYDYFISDFVRKSNLSRHTILRALQSLHEKGYISKDVEYVNNVKYCHYSIIENWEE